MPKVTFVTEDGAEIVENDAIGTLMEIARQNDVDGIVGACGGVCSCATCHVRVTSEWIERVGRPGEDEQDLLELEKRADERSRLSCQIEMTDELDGLVVEVLSL
jgi:2Fe-2S ferredoxin